MKREEHIAEFKQYCPPSYIDQYDEENNVTPGEWRIDMMPQHIQPLHRIGANRAATDAITLRNNIAEYFLSDIGQILWQWIVINRGMLINIPERN